MIENDRLIELRDELKNYQWMISESYRLREKIRNMQDELDNDDLSNTPVVSGLPSMSGLTKGNEYITSQSRIKKLVKRLKRIDEKTTEILKLYEYVERDREWTALDCRLDGMNMREIARHLNVSPRQAYRFIDNVLKRYLIDQ